MKKLSWIFMVCIIGCLCLGFLTASVFAKDNSDRSSDKALVVGEGLVINGHWIRLGESADEIFEALGWPGRNKVAVWTDKDGYVFYLYIYPEVQFAAMPQKGCGESEAKIFLIIIHSDEYMTREGIKVGDSIESVKTAYRQYTKDFQYCGVSDENVDFGLLIPSKNTMFCFKEERVVYIAMNLYGFVSKKGGQ